MENYPQNGMIFVNKSATIIKSYQTKGFSPGKCKITTYTLSCPFTLTTLDQRFFYVEWNTLQHIMSGGRIVVAYPKICKSHVTV